MIFLASCGRSGSAWLSTVFCALGLTVRHEGYPVIPDPDVISDTSWLWNSGTLINNLEQRNRMAIADTVILLDRPRKEIERSVAKLIGKEHNWDRAFAEWERLKDAVWNKGLTQVLRSGFRINYADLFEPKFKATLIHILSSSGHRDKIDDVDRVLNFMWNIRCTNKTSEEETIQSYGYGIGN